MRTRERAIFRKYLERRGLKLTAERRAKAERAMDRVRGKFGHEAVLKGLALDED